MKKFVFYTSEGYTEAPDGEAAVDNCQILGWACGETLQEAERRLLAENPWIAEAGYSPCEIRAQQVLTSDIGNYIETVLGYFGERRPDDCNPRLAAALENLRRAI